MSTTVVTVPDVLTGADVTVSSEMTIQQIEDACDAAGADFFDTMQQATAR